MFFFVTSACPKMQNQLKRIAITFAQRMQYYKLQSNSTLRVNIQRFVAASRMQKVSIFVLSAVVAFASAAYVQPHFEPQDIYAEPNCAVVNDHGRMFRDISDPTHYWICPENQAKARYIQCPANEAFMESLQKCVVWEEWKWVEPYTN